MPIALYGLILLMAALAYTVLQRTIIASQGGQSLLKTAVGEDWKGKVSLLLYMIAIPTAFQYEWASDALYVLVALLWLISDRRIENVLGPGEPIESPR